ncbi:hypothetical protein EDD86DRAFT_193994 [Gorgonomyces haynaldii]|nr:hypothetical protein EDD86DRAFT_193994 [Gorgonomyces haynaldii]
MSKGITTKDALKVWEEKNQKPAAEATVVKMYMQQPFIAKMDASLSALVKCEQLSLSSNLIDKISNLQGLSALRVLSLGRNSIKKIEGLEAVADTLEELWMSYNLLEKLNGVECCKKLKVLYVSNNKIKEWAGIQPISALPALEDFLGTGNPIEEKATPEGTWIPEFTKRFVQVKKLDGKPLIRSDAAMEQEESK